MIKRDIVDKKINGYEMRKLFTDILKIDIRETETFEMIAVE